MNSCTEPWCECGGCGEMVGRVERIYTLSRVIWKQTRREILKEIPLSCIIPCLRRHWQKPMEENHLALESPKWWLKTTCQRQTHGKPFWVLENCSIKSPVCQILFIKQRVERQRKIHLECEGLHTQRIKDKWIVAVTNKGMLFARLYRSYMASHL